jgi:predicted nucleic acid-binding Zn ribbon protein
VSESTPQAAGADLARQALAAARAAAKTSPVPVRKTGGRVKRHQRGAGRDPMAVGALLDKVSAEQGWPKALEGGNVLGRWAELCPQFADTVQPTGYDPERGVLELRPSSHAIASGLRLMGGQLAKQINDKVGSPVVRAIRVLSVGTVTARGQETPDGPPAAAAPQAPVRTRETASPGYRITLEAHQAAKPDGMPTNPYVADAIERQNQVLAHPANREPETAFTDAVAELEHLTAPAVNRAEQIRRAAIARKRGGDDAAPVRRAFDVA